MKLTKSQQDHLDNLRANGKVFIGYNSRLIMNIYDNLVAKGVARVIEENSYGKKYQEVHGNKAE